MFLKNKHVKAVGAVLASLAAGTAASPSNHPAQDWEVHRGYLGPFHLGDESISSWSPLVGACVNIEFPFVRAGGKLGLTYEPYGLESAYIELPSGQRFILAPQTVYNGRRPNYWGDNTGFEFPLERDSAAGFGRICSDYVAPRDIDDLMIRNIQTWRQQSVRPPETATDPAYIAEDLSGYDMFYTQLIESPYFNNWYVRLDREVNGIYYFSIVADGKLPYSGTLITACNSDFFQDSVVPNDGSEHYVIEEDVVTELYRWVCTS
jgi:hypothetical protein